MLKLLINKMDLKNNETVNYEENKLDNTEDNYFKNIENDYSESSDEEIYKKKYFDYNAKEIKNIEKHKEIIKMYIINNYAYLFKHNDVYIIIFCMMSGSYADEHCIFILKDNKLKQFSNDICGSCISDYKYEIMFNIDPKIIFKIYFENEEKETLENKLEIMYKENKIVCECIKDPTIVNILIDSINDIDFLHLQPFYLINNIDVIETDKKASVMIISYLDVNRHDDSAKYVNIYIDNTIKFDGYLDSIKVSKYGKKSDIIVNDYHLKYINYKWFCDDKEMGSPNRKKWKDGSGRESYSVLTCENMNEYNKENNNMIPKYIFEEKEKREEKHILERLKILEYLSLETVKEYNLEIKETNN